MVSSDKEQLNQLDRLIQNAEFETKQQTQAITEERHKIETLQKQLNDQLCTIKELELATGKSDENIKKLHKRLVQHKENYESLKRTSSVLDEHIEALQKKLLYSCQTTQQQSVEQRDAFKKYQNIWSSYEEKYQSCPKAQELMALKKQFETIQNQNKSLQTMIDSLETKLSMLQMKCNSREEMTGWVLKISSLRMDTSSTEHTLRKLRECVKSKIKDIQITKDQITIFEKRIRDLQVEKEASRKQEIMIGNAVPPPSPRMTARQSFSIPCLIKPPKNLPPAKTHTSSELKLRPESKKDRFTVNLPKVVPSHRVSINVPNRAKGLSVTLPEKSGSSTMYRTSAITPNNSTVSKATNIAFNVTLPSSSCLPVYETNTTPSLPQSMPVIQSTNLPIVTSSTSYMTQDIHYPNNSENEVENTLVKNNNISMRDVSSCIVEDDKDMEQQTQSDEASPLQHIHDVSNMNLNDFDNHMFTSNTSTSSWLGVEENQVTDSNNQLNFDLFSSFSTDGSSNMGNLFGESSLQSGTSIANGPDEGTFSLFDASTVSDSNSTGFEMFNFTDTSSNTTNTTSFSLF